MRMLILGLCALVAGGVFATMAVSLWSTRRAGDGPHLHRSAVGEFVWLAIPCLMVLAAAIPAVMAILAAPAGH